MKKLLLLLSLLTISFTYALAYVPASGNMNPFAYDLKSTYEEENMKLTFEFKVNAPAISIRVYAKDSQDRTYLLATYTPASNAAIPISIYEQVLLKDKSLPIGEDFTWYVDVEGRVHDNVEFYSNSNKLWYPTSIDIDNNPENPNFGTVFCIEGRYAATNDTQLPYKYKSTYDNNKEGLYMMYPYGEMRRLPIKELDGYGIGTNTERYGYNGGNTFKGMHSFTYNGTTKDTGFAPCRVRVSDDGRVFVSAMSSTGRVLWEIPRECFSTTNHDIWNAAKNWKKIIAVENANTKKGTNDNLYSTLNETFIAGPNVGFDVRGSGSDLQLLMLSGSNAAIVDASNHNGEFRCDEYNLGRKQLWNTSPNREVFTGTVLMHNASQVQYDKNGNVYMCQYRAYDGSITLMKVDKNGTKTTILTDGFHRCGAMRFSNDFSKLALTSKGPAYGGGLSIYDVDKSGNLDLNTKNEINIVSQVGQSMMDFAWDYAGNLYVAADLADGADENSPGRCIAIYAMPNNNGKNIVSTPAASRYNFSTKYSVTWHNLFLHNQDVADDVFNRSNQNTRLWRLIQVGLSKYHIEAGGTKSDVKDYADKINGSRKLLAVQEFFNVSSSADFLAEDHRFMWLGRYLSETTEAALTESSFKYLDELINQTGSFVEKGKPENWRPLFTKTVMGLNDKLPPNAYLPITWNVDSESYMTDHWVTSWGYGEGNLAVEDLFTENPETSGWNRTSRPAQWYHFNTVKNHYSMLGHLFMSNDSHILAWRRDSQTGDIVHRVTEPGMKLYATYVRKNIDENDKDVDLSVDAYDVKNNDLFQLFDNRNYVPNNPTKIPTHNLTVTRRLVAGMYNTICLPLVDKDKDYLDLTLLTVDHPLAYDNGNGAEVLKFTGVTSTVNTTGKKITLLNFERVTQMYVGEPYLVKLREGATDLTEDIPFNTVSCRPEEHPVTLDGLIFNPTINPTTIPAGSIILVADNRLALTTEEGQMAGLRGYFTVAPAQAKEIAEQAADGRVVFSVKQPVTTSVVDVQQPEVQTVQKILEDGNIYIIRGNEKYDLMGRLQSKQ